MVSSTLNPQAITRSNPVAPNSFGSFMTGGSGLDSSTFADATNKIVNFSRPNVSPIPSNITNIVSNISTNILNQVDNSIRNTTNFIKSDFENQIKELRNDFYSRLSEVQANTNDLQRDVIRTTTEIQQQIISQQQPQVQQETPVSGIQKVIANIQEQVQNVLDNTLKSFSQDYQQKIKGFDDKRPNNVLSKFLDLYQNAIGFVNFFGNRKNIETVEKNLKAIRVMFNESFEVAKVLRQTIIKIVKQLSNLPTASPNSGGLNLDVNVPGGRLKQAGGPKIRNIGRGAGLGAAAGIGLLGMGGLATAASGMGRAKQYQEEMLASGVQAAPMDQSIPEGFIDAFSSIVDRFTSAVEGLLKGAKSSPSSPGGGGGPAGGPSAAPSSSGPSSYSPGTIPESVKSDTGFTGGVTELAKKYNIPEDYLYAVMGFETGGTFSPSQRNQAGSGATGLIQFMPQTAEGLGTTTEALSKMSRSEQLKYVDKYFSGKGIEGGTLEDVYMSALFPAAVGKPNDYVLFGKGAMSGYTGTAYTQNKGLDLNNDGSITKAEAASKVKQYLPKSVDNLSIASSKVSPAPAQTQMTQTRAQAISQPAQQVPQTISLPPTVIDATSQQQDSGGGGIVSPPPPSGGVIDIPMLPTGNPDNFLTMYSRIVYNIVDG